MDSSTTGIMLLGLILVGLAALLLAGGVPAPAGSEAVSPQPAPVAASTVQSPPPRPTAAPIVDAGPSITLEERGSARLRAQGYDPSGGMVTYLWSAPAGRFDDPHALQPVYTAPSVCGCEECIPLTLTVTNRSGVSASDQVYVRVYGDPISCSSSVERSLCAPTPNPCQAQEPVKPHYNCQYEPPPCESSCIHHVMPEPTCPQAPVPCCTSPCGWPLGFLVSSPEQSVRPADHPHPLIDRRYPAYMDEGGAVRITAKVNNPACTSVCFTWTASKGWFEDADTLSPIYHAPLSDRSDGEDATITLTIHDGFGGKSHDQIRIHIRNLYPQRRP